MIISKGAEAEIHLEDNRIIKKRVPKTYRLKKIDDSLRRSRTKREAKILQSLPKEIPAPKLMKAGETDIEMQHIKGEKVRDILEGKIEICREIGEKIAMLHNHGIVHGDLTTSNMLYDRKIYLIDFGLSYFSDKVEDKAVDLHLLRQALESKHHMIFKRAFSLVLEGYKKKSENYRDIKERLEKVESRGRNKGKY
jgi:TP53 regulating kinase and related kinases